MPSRLLNHSEATDIVSLPKKKKMVSLMRTWLCPFVQQELEKAIDWKKSTAYYPKNQISDYNSIVKTEEGPLADYSVESRSITDDGSNLRVSVVLSTGYEHAVQIVRVTISLLKLAWETCF